VLTMNGPLTALAVLGASVWAVRHFRARDRGKAADKPEDKKVTPTTLVLLPAYLESDDEPAGEPGAPGGSCMPEYAGLAAWDREGECKIFWFDGTTDEAIRELARTGWADRGKPTVSEMCFAVPDPLGGEFATLADNPIMVEIVADALHAYYGVAGHFPPREDSYFWVKSAWKRANAVVRIELCGAP